MFAFFIILFVLTVVILWNCGPLIIAFFVVKKDYKNHPGYYNKSYIDDIEDIKNTLHELKDNQQNTETSTDA